jgi:hypothetical protein
MVKVALRAYMTRPGIRTVRCSVPALLQMPSGAVLARAS